MVPYFYIGGQIIWAKQYNVVWKQLAFMGTILFFPYPFSLKKIVKIKPIFFQNYAISQDSWKRQLGLNFFSISAYGEKELVV